MRKLILTLLLCISGIILCSFAASNKISSDSWTPPAKVTLADSTDFDKYADDVISCKTWMEATPFTEKDGNWKNASQFMLQWVVGSPRFTMEIYPFLLEYSSQKNKSFLVVFMTGAAANSVANNYISTNIDNFVAGFKLVNKVYLNAAKKKKDKKILALIKLEKEGKLKEWVEQQMKDVE